MNQKKITYNSQTRNDISNKFNKFSHQDLLRMANIQVFKGIYEIEHLANGRIKAKTPTKPKKN